MIYSLYLKIHNKTGLKYLGQTEKDPFIYKGSGKYWKRHLKTHGNDVTTEILFQSSNIEELIEKGLFFSYKWNIVESEDFANLIEEKGNGGGVLKGTKWSEETKRKMSETRKKFMETEYGKELLKKHVLNFSSMQQRGIHRPWVSEKINKNPEKIKKTAAKNTGQKRTAEQKQKISEAMIRSHARRKDLEHA